MSLQAAEREQVNGIAESESPGVETGEDTRKLTRIGNTDQVHVIGTQRSSANWFWFYGYSKEL